MSVIVPAILPRSRDDLEHKLAVLVNYVDSVQIDVVDGRFVSPAAWPYSGKGEFDPDVRAHIQEIFLPYLGKLHVEMDLMVSDSEKSIGTWIDAGAERIVLHAESSHSMNKVMPELGLKYGHAKGFAPDLLSLGIAVNVETDIAMIEPYLDTADYVQFMGIGTIGKQGQPFDQRVLRKIAQFRSKHPDMFIQVDGGVSRDTLPQLLAAGVDRLVVGSDLWNAQDFKNELDLLTRLVKEFNT